MTDHLIELDMDWHAALPPEGRLHVQHWWRGLPPVDRSWRKLADERPEVFGVRVDPSDPNRGELLLERVPSIGPVGEIEREWVPTMWGRPFPMAFVPDVRHTALSHAPRIDHPLGRPLDDDTQLQRRVQALELVVAALVIRGSTESLAAQPAIETPLSEADLRAVPGRFSVAIYEVADEIGAARVRVSRPAISAV